MNSEPRRYDFVDALRGIAVFGVLLVHTHQNFHTDIGASYIGLGQYGVMLFYIVSAFSLMLSLSKRSKNERSPLINYFIRRLFRIAPLFYVAVAIYLSRKYIFPENSFPVDLSHSNFLTGPLDLLLTLTFLNGWSYRAINLIVPGGWSVAVETNFYIILPLLFYFATGIRKTVLLFFCFIIFGKVLTKFLYLWVVPFFPDVEVVHWDIFAGMWLPNQIPVFVAGILMCHLFVNRNNNKYVEWATSVIVLLCFMISMFAVYVAFFDILKNSYVAFNYFMLILAVLFSLLLAKYPAKLFVNRIVVYVGGVSYGIYLFHFIVIQLLVYLQNIIINDGGDPISFFVAMPLVLCMSLMIASLCNKYIEVPGQNLGKRIIESLEMRG